MQRSPSNQQTQSRLDKYYENVSPKSDPPPKELPPQVTQCKKRARQSSADDMSQEDILSEILMTVRRLDGTVSDLSSKLDGLESSLSYAHQEISSLQLENTELKSANVALNTRVDSLERRFEGLELNLENERYMRDENEANSRLQNLEISGIPKKEGETRADCKKHCAAVMTLIGSENGADAIDVAHRKMSGGIILRFKSRSQRDEVYLKRFSLVGKSSLDLGFRTPTPGNPIYLNESLSFDRARLMKSIRDNLKIINAGKNKEERIKVKSANGRILVQNQAGNFICVNKIEQFNALHPNAI